MKNNKGFTLIELLAVIVILAILVLIATPAITNIMTKSAKNSFKNEVVGLVSDVEKAYTEKIGDEVLEKTLDGNSATQVLNISVNNQAYAYLCMTLKDLINEQYSKKNLGEKYGGYIQMWVPDGNGESITFVNVTNGRYYLQGLMSVVSRSKFLPTQTASQYATLPNTQTKCPDDYSIPSSSIYNVQDKATEAELEDIVHK